MPSTTQRAKPAFWPRGLPLELHLPETSLCENLSLAAARYPHKAALIFYGSRFSYGALVREVDRIAAFLAGPCRVAPGDRVALLSQNCPQYAIAYYAILRAGAVVVPLNAMLLTEELRHCVTDSGARVAFAAQELAPKLAPLMGEGRLAHVVTFAYSDYLIGPKDNDLPDFVLEPATLPAPGTTAWRTVLDHDLPPPARLPAPDDLCLLAYTSGTTGAPKACMHTHRSIMTAAVASQLWRGNTVESVILLVAPMFHLMGMQNGLNAPFYLGATTVVMARWNPQTAARLIEAHRVTSWSATPAMLLDMFSGAAASNRDISSLAVVTGGGTATPEIVTRTLKDKLGLDYVEGFGMTETAAFLHCNPMARSKAGCLGLPTFGVESRVIDPETLQELPPGEAGELITHGAQVMQGYWNNPAANAQVFIERDGKRFLRTGDIAYVDDEGYFWMKDRLKRMINASGFKVWPAEVEGMLHEHPAVLEACVIPVMDARRGETVVAVLACRPGQSVAGEDLLAWCRQRMAAYKTPRRVRFVEALPRMGTGKVDWRLLRHREEQSPEPEGE